MNNALVLYAVGACVALGATLLYAVALLLVTVLVRETRDLIRYLKGRPDGHGKPTPGD